MKTPKKRAPRITDRIASGLDHIYSYMDNEHCVRQDSSIECHCEGCGSAEDCLCYGKPYAKQCENCRLYEDLGLALSWLGQMISRHQEAK